MTYSGGPKFDPK